MATRVTIEQLPMVIQREAYEVRRAIVRGVNRTAERGRTLLVRRSPKDLGELKASWKVRRVSDRARAKLAQILNDAPHGGIVEAGARPHGVSLEGRLALYEWARRHFYFTTGRSSRRRRVKGGAFEDPVLTEIVWGIVHKLRRQGQKPTYFVRDSLPKLEDYLRSELRRAIKKVAGKDKS